MQSILKRVSKTIPFTIAVTNNFLKYIKARKTCALKIVRHSPKKFQKITKHGRLK